MKKKSDKNLSFIFVFLLVGAVCGFVSVYYLDSVFEEYGFLLSIAFKLFIFVFAFYIQLIIHEAGHLIFGLLSGYSFGSFRAGSIMIVKENGKLGIKKQTLAGTGGQCLMIPPPISDGNLPFMLYNFGGVLLNFLTLPICVLLLAHCIGKPLPYAICIMMFLAGFIIFITNGVPMRLGMLNNDGSNALELRRSKEARIVFYNQFIMLDNLRNGVRLRDMPDELFFMPSDEGMKNSISASGAVFLENRLVDQGRFEEAEALIDKLLRSSGALTGLHKNMLLNDKIFIELLLGRASSARALFEGKEYTSFAKQMKTNISIIRTSYAIEKLALQNNEGAKKIISHFEKCAAAHPYSVESDCERELIGLIDKIAV